jgi:hypothetical protein
MEERMIVRLMMTASIAIAPLAAAAAAQPDAAAPPALGFCSQTTEAQFAACGYEKLDDFHVARALCINISDQAARATCFDAAGDELEEGKASCGAQRKARLKVCGVIGEARYERSFLPADFEKDYHNLQHPNPYFPLTIGYRWDYDGSLETNTITALNETKLIEGVTCIVLDDKRYENGKLVEDTDDWYGQRKDGTVEFCGEAVSNFETFRGDRPARPERISTDGQWKTGRDGIPSGPYILGSPKIGEAHRSEFAPGDAEDSVRYLSKSYRHGVDPKLDKFVPRALASIFCHSGDCWVTEEFTGLEPGEVTRKYYAKKVGFFLGVDAVSGDTVQLVNCNFDPRCKTLPKPVKSARSK